MAGVSFSADLRARTARTWDAAVAHRFVDELWRGAVPAPVLTTYLVQDHQFVDGFVALMGAAVAAADRAEPRIVHARQLGLVAGSENDIFDRALDALGLPDSDRTSPTLLGPTRGFLDLMDGARRSGSYAETLAVLVATSTGPPARTRPPTSRSRGSGSSCTGGRPSSSGWVS